LERLIETDSGKTDTDGDRISDYQELLQGTDPKPTVLVGNGDFETRAGSLEIKETRRGSLIIEYRPPDRAPYSLAVHDINGSTRTLAQGRDRSGAIALRMDAGTLTPGIHFISLVSGKNRVSRRVFINPDP
jgi:hypothetical protein